MPCYRVVRGILGVLVLAFSVTLVGADVFTHPPESSTAPGEWESLYPYPRNATIDFATDPSTWPADSDDPTGEGDWAKDLLSGVNYDIDGWDDPSLYDGDWWAFSWPYLAWHADDPAGSGRTGIFEFYNEGAGPPGPDPAMYWQLSDSSGADAKHIWLEMIARPPADVIYYLSVSAFVAGDDMQADDPCWVSEPELRFSEDLGDGWLRKSWYIEADPSPDWETIKWSFQIPSNTMPGSPDPFSSWYIDEIHIATEAVPEPGTVVLFGLGLLGVAARLRRRFTSR